MLNVLCYVYIYKILECSSEFNYVLWKTVWNLAYSVFFQWVWLCLWRASTFACFGGFEILNIHNMRWTFQQQLKRDKFYKGWNSLSIFLCWHLEKLQGIESDLKGIHPFKPLLWQTMRTESWFLGLRHMYKIAVLILF